jgi:hypothetical protein
LAIAATHEQVSDRAVAGILQTLVVQSQIYIKAPDMRLIALWDQQCWHPSADHDHVVSVFSEQSRQF